jgi:acetyl-CoA acetyltransferase
VRDVAVIAFAQAPNLPETSGVNDVEILMPVLDEALTASGIPRKEIGFTCSGSSDYLAGQPFSFVMGLDAVGPWPPITESHVEMDGAWALYEAWTRLQHGDLDSALVYAFGKSSTGDLGRVLALQLDPYTAAPLWPDPANLAALQARAYLDTSGRTEADLAEVAVRSRRNAKDNPAAQVHGDVSIDELLAAPYVSSPLRAHDCPPVSDGAAAIVLAAGDLARAHCARPAWIRGIDHRIEAHALGLRDLTTSSSTSIAGEKAGVGHGPVDVAELHAPYTHQELILRDALGLNGETSVNPSGGALAGNPMMSAGLARIGEAARRIIDGSAGRAVAHATSGACLQQNLVAVLEAG